MHICYGERYARAFALVDYHPTEQDLSVEALFSNWRSGLMFAVCFSIAFVCLKLVLQKTERRANFFFAGFLIAVAALQMPQVIGFAGFYDRDLRWSFAPFATEFYLGPLIYLHTFSLMQRGPLGWRWAWLAPGVGQTLYYLVGFLVFETPAQIAAFRRDFQLPIFDQLETFGGLGLGVFAIAACSELLVRYRCFLTDTQTAEGLFEPTWIKHLLIWAMVLIGLFVLLAGYEAFFAPRPYFSVYPFYLVIALVVAWLGLEAVARTNQTFPKMDIAGAQIPGDNDIATPGPNDWRQAGDLVAEVLKGEQLYLNPRLSRADIARALSTNETYISRAINTGLGTNLSALVNEMRIEAAKAELSSTDKSVLTIALDVGFNSKPTFYRLFRETVGMTPSAYREASRKRAQAPRPD